MALEDLSSAQPNSVSAGMPGLSRRLTGLLNVPQDAKGIVRLAMMVASSPLLDLPTLLVQTGNGKSALLEFAKPESGSSDSRILWRDPHMQRVCD